METSNNIKVKSKKARFSKCVNAHRRKVMSFLTKNVGKSHINKFSSVATDIKISKILIVRPNHRLGNMILTTPLIQEVIDTFPNCEIDLLAKGRVAPIVFREYENIKDFILLPRKPFSELIKYCLVWLKVKNRKYDLVINAVKGSSSGKLLTKISNSRYKVFGEIEDEVIDKTSDNYHIAKNPIYNLREYLSVIGINRDNKEIASLDIKLKASELSYGANILKDTFNNENKTISIFTYATGSKCYTKSWWNKFYTLLKTTFIDYNILEILPVENISQIDFQAKTFYSNDIRKIGSVIANSVVFVGADSGIMHLASSTKTTTIGLFSKTKIEKYKPYGNGSFAINTQATNIKECVSQINDILNKDKVLTTNLFLH